LQERIYNDHVRLLSPEPVGWLSHHQLYSDVGADIVMESITLIDSNLGGGDAGSKFLPVGQRHQLV
jgi:hypothetical protein